MGFDHLIPNCDIVKRITTLTPRNKENMWVVVLLSSRIATLLKNLKPTEILSKSALKKHNVDNQTNLEFVRAVKANWHHGGGYSFYITFEANDHSHSEPIIFQASVGYLPLNNVWVYEIKPKP